MPVAEPNYIGDMAEEILDAVRSVYTTNGLTLPARQLLAPGGIVDDCDQVAVSFIRLFSGRPGAEVTDPEQCGFARSAEFTVRLTRCITVVTDDGRLPNAAAVTADARELYRDAWVLFQGLIELRGSGAFLSTCQNLLMGNVVVDDPEGGLGSAELTIQVQVQ